MGAEPLAPPDDELRRILLARPVIALVGASSKTWRPSHGVMAALLAQGYEVIPVHPREREVLGRPVYPSLAAVPRRVDLVDVFRRAEDTPPVAREAVEVGARVLWLQLGIVNHEAARIARQAGLTVVMDRCTIIEHERLIGAPLPGQTPAERVAQDPVGLCRTCRHADLVTTQRSEFWRCGRSDSDTGYGRYPRLPVVDCRGYERTEPDG